jgi:hypothetical protein
VLLLRSEQPGGEQALATAEVEHAGCGRNQAQAQQAGESGVAHEFAAREMPGETAGVAVGRRSGIDHAAQPVGGRGLGVAGR